MSLFYRYISFSYIRYFLILFIALECFFVFIDLMRFVDDFPNSANLVVLLIVYEFIYASGFILPLALILAQIVLINIMLRSSQWTAFLALGYSKFNIFFPIFLISFVITASFIALNATPFAYAKEKIELIVERGYVGSYKSNVLLKYQQYYIYFEKIFPLLQSAEGVRVYEFNPQTLLIDKVIQSQRAVFNGEEWRLEDVKIIIVPKDLKLGETPIAVEHQESYTILEGFKPKILDNIYERQGSISLMDAYEAIKLLSQQGINTQKLRASFYALLLFPLFAPLMMISLSRFVPDTNRYVHLGMMVFGMLLSILLLWGIFFSLSRLAISGFLLPEIGILLPFAVFMVVGGWMFLRLLK
ncbi:LptF/LptG family permease [Helicobacter mesocricetorum]|uniref:LptF/LptG family permease n=1 Tax=Helicobacter mesocricetorum TaxID=87012 RepID=UPI000CF06832|nr:LptF/LptG family permease [Helicobacter mesocricetorum]